MWLSHATSGMQMNEIIIVLVLIGDAYVNISRLSYVDKGNKKLYDEEKTLIIPHSQHQPG